MRSPAGVQHIHPTATVSACQDRFFIPESAAMSQYRGHFPRTPILQTVIAVIPLFLTAVPSFAANRNAQANRTDQANRSDQERAARKACLNGDYTKGVGILSDLFVDTKDTTYIFNQGRCFEQNRRYEDAAARFEEYLTAAEGKLSAEDKAAAEKHLATCKEKLAKERGRSTIEPATVPVVPPTTYTATLPEPKPSPETTTEPSAATLVQSAPQQEPGQRRWGLLTAGIITGAVGVGGVVAGVVFNLKANSLINDMETKVGTYSAAKENDQKSYKTLAWVGYGVGAACVVAGAVLIGLGAKSGPTSSTDVALVPSVGPGQVGALLTGGF